MLLLYILLITYYILCILYIYMLLVPIHICKDYHHHNLWPHFQRNGGNIQIFEESGFLVLVSHGLIGHYRIVK